MTEKVRSLVELRNMIAEATDKAYDCLEPETAAMLAVVERLVMNRIVETQQPAHQKQKSLGLST